ncbi:hypothetical protein D3Z38_06195 [Clostridiales bacterium]|nr:hypothetical protein [Clostridiales bacterium]
MKKKEQEKHGAFFAVIVVLILAAAYLMLCAGVNPERIMPNTTVNGVSLDNMSLDEAVAALEADTAARHAEAELTITAGEKSYTLALGELLSDIDCANLADQAIYGSNGPFLARGLFRLWNALIGLHITNFPTVTDPNALHQKIKASGLPDLDTTIQTTYQKKNDQLIFTMGTAGASTDEAALMKEILSALDEGDYDTPVACPMTPGSVKPVDIDTVYRKLHTEAADATLDPKNGYQIVKSVTGVDFDKAAAKKILEEAKEGSTAVIDLICTEPAITTSDMEKNLCKDLLATHTTKVGGSANRIANIRLAAAKCNGTVLLSGEEFSFNDTVGEQTAETGFRKANAIQGKNIIQAYGGGICQVSTTLFIPALYAGLDIPERWCHNYVSSYAEPGMDAAVAWGGLDFRIVNNKKYPIALQVTYANSRLTVSIWGTKTEESSVKVETKVLNSSSDTLEVRTTRKISSAGDGNVVIQRFDSSYLNPSMRQD